jgi:hypothetical protein
MNLIISVLIGTGLGAALGYFGKCSTGACPLTANWWRGALYGAVLGLVFGVVSGRTSTGSTVESTPNVKQVTEKEFDAEVVKSSQPVVWTSLPLGADRARSFRRD